MTKIDAHSHWDDQSLGPDSALLHGRTAVVTGAAQGIGRATALAMARFGADVAICDWNPDGLQDAAKEIESTGRRVTAVELDVRDDDAVQAFASAVADAHESVEILVNNVGGGFHAAVLDVSQKGELALIRENFTQVTSCVRAFVPRMPGPGSIINVTSVEAHRAGPGFGIYSAMKAAVVSLTETLSMELGPRGIRVNCIAPDMIPTPGDAQLGDDSDAMALPVATSSLPNGGRPDDCAAAAVFLAGDMASFVSGSTIHVDGGTLAAGGWKILDGGGGFSL